MFVPIFAQLKPGQQERLLAAAGLLALAILVGAGLLALIDRWRKRQMSDTRSEAASLTSYRAMLESGELSQEEYDKILARAAGKLKGRHPEVAPTRPAKPGQPLPDDEGD
jgi:hypothetical protein